MINTIIQLNQTNVLIPSIRISYKCSMNCSIVVFKARKKIISKEFRASRAPHQVRKLDVGEVVEALEEPEKEETVGIYDYFWYTI